MIRNIFLLVAMPSHAHMLEAANVTVTAGAPAIDPA